MSIRHVVQPKLLILTEAKNSCLTSFHRRGTVKLVKCLRVLQARVLLNVLISVSVSMSQVESA